MIPEVKGFMPIKVSLLCKVVLIEPVLIYTDQAQMLRHADCIGISFCAAPQHGIRVIHPMRSIKLADRRPEEVKNVMPHALPRTVEG